MKQLFLLVLFMLLDKTRILLFGLSAAASVTLNKLPLFAVVSV